MPFLEMARSGGALWKMLDINAFLHKRAIPLMARCAKFTKSYDKLHSLMRRRGDSRACAKLGFPFFSRLV